VRGQCSVSAPTAARDGATSLPLRLQKHSGAPCTLDRWSWWRGQALVSPGASRLAWSSVGVAKREAPQ